MTPENSKTESEYKLALAEEKERESYQEAKRMARSVHRNVRNMGIIRLVHEFGEDVECPCNHCS